MSQSEDDSPVPQSLIESAMDTGQGADDEPEMTIGDRFDDGTDAEDNTDDKLSLDEAARLLGQEKESVK